MRSAPAVLLLALALGAPALAQPDDGAGPIDEGRVVEGFAVDTPFVGVQFGPDAEHAIRSYFEADPAEPLSDTRSLADPLERGDRLAPDIARRELPEDLRAQLPAFPGHEIVVVDDDVLLVATATQVIVDVLSDVP